LEIAARHNLLVTGGSDCHGYSKGKPLIGGVRLPGFYFEKLKERRQSAAAARVPHPQSPRPHGLV
jgi:hypothetical protein